jgi:hypothetical protein
MRPLLIAFVFTTTCAFAQEKLAEPSAAPDDEPDKFLHVQSGMHFPEHVGEFHRTRVNRFNPEGSDMGVDYKLGTPEGNDYVTVFIYPAAGHWRPGEDEDRVYDALEKSMICKQELASRQSELLKIHTESSLGPVKTIGIEQNGSAHQGSRINFAAMAKAGSAGGVMKEELDLFCFATELWTISYRFTYADYPGADADIAQFMRDLKWPQQ